MWYYTLNGQNFGPLNDADLDALVRNGTLANSTLIWKEGMAGWQPYSQLRSAVPPLLKASAPIPIMDPNDAASGTFDAASRLEDAERFARKAQVEAFTSWGTVVALVIGMFLFIGMLASRAGRPHARYSSSSYNSVQAEAKETLQATVSLKNNSVYIRNDNQFDWSITFISFMSGGKQFSHQIAGLRSNASTDIPLSEFKSSPGNYFATGVNPAPQKLAIVAMGCNPRAFSLRSKL